MTRPDTLAAALAAAYLAGEWQPASMAARAQDALGLTVKRPPAWLLRVTRSVVLDYQRPPRDRARELAASIAGHPDLRKRAAGLGVTHWHSFTPEMARPRWRVPDLPSVGALADLLGVSVITLEGYADTQHRARRAAPRQVHYRALAMPTRSGGVRVLEAPRHRLKALQRVVNAEILQRLPLHPAAHGFVPGHSPLTMAAAHVGRPRVVLLDLESFFASIGAGRVFGVFRLAGYPEPVAHLLTGLCTTVLPAVVERTLPDLRWALRRRLATPHLPQGAPTSPALANLVAFTLDRRLDALASSFGATYTRYADDLAFSGGLGRARSQRLAAVAATIVVSEGFVVNKGKSRTLRSDQRQQIAGVVVNVHPASPREEVDQLRAVLHNCITHGPASQNLSDHNDFRGYLLGRISWVTQLHPARGAKLHAEFDRISWA